MENDAITQARRQQVNLLWGSAWTDFKALFILFTSHTHTHTQNTKHAYLSLICAEQIAERQTRLQQLQAQLNAIYHFQVPFYR
jgi:hypothetical protein